MLKDKRQLDDAHSLSLSLFNQTWAEKKKKILDDLAQEEEKIKGKIKEKAQKKEENKISVPSKPKPDPNYLNLKKTKEALIKQKQYDKAYEVEQKIKKIEKIKQAQWEDLKNEKKIIKTERQVKANEQVLQNFAAKKELALFEFERSKKKEFDHLSKKYKNTATDLALSQKTLKTRLTSTEKVSQKELSQSKPELKPVEITDTSTSIAD